MIPSSSGWQEKKSNTGLVTDIKNLPNQNDYTTFGQSTPHMLLSYDMVNNIEGIM